LNFYGDVLQYSLQAAEATRIFRM